MAQIEPFERPYNIVYGEDGAKASIVNFEDGPDVPIYKARNLVTAIVFENLQKLAEDDPEREALDKIRRMFREASGGDLVFGKVARWVNRKGKTRFIGIVEKGQDYTTAGQTRSQRDPNYKPPTQDQVRHFRTASEQLDDTDRSIRRDEARRGSRPVATPAAKRQTEAERIADKMAKASRQAAEGDQS